MKEELRELRRDTFLGDASDYAAVRPEYPTALLEASLEFSGLAAGSELLEIGCGTGVATEWYARRGLSVLAMDRSEEMLVHARRRLADYTNVVLEVGDFELRPPSTDFDGLLAATAYHWLRPDERAGRCAACLRSGGSLMLLWHTHPPPFEGFFSSVQEIYRRLVPEWVPPPSPGMVESRIQAVVSELDDCGLFEPPDRRSHEWSRAFAREDYLRLLNTYSDHLLLPADGKAQLFVEIGDLIDAEFGGEVVRPYRTELVVARRL